MLPQEIGADGTRIRFRTHHRQENLEEGFCVPRGIVVGVVDDDEMFAQENRIKLEKKLLLVLLRKNLRVLKGWIMT